MRDITSIFFGVVIAIVIIIAGGILFFKSGIIHTPSSVTTTVTTTTTIAPNIYKYVTTKPTGWFKTGQMADIVLYATGFDDSGGSLVLNHPGKVATDGKRLIVSDTWNNRVLIWNEIPTRNDQTPDLVLGQPDFNSNTGRLGANGMNWPMGVTTDGKKLLVADANNDRILIWNEFPTRNGQPADIVLGADDFSTWPTYYDRDNQKPGNPDPRDPQKRIYWPWDVWTDGERVVVTSTTDSSVLIWNSFPTKNNQAANLVSGQLNFSMRFRDTREIPNWPIKFVTMSTPRSIASDGKYLVIGMYGGYGAYVWNNFPTRNGQPADLILYPCRQTDEPVDMIAGLYIKDNKLFAASSHHIFVWNTLPSTNNQKQDLRIGVQRTRDEYLIAPDKYLFFPDTFAFPEGVASDGKKLIIIDTNFNRVLIFNQIPDKSDAKADVILGKPEIFLSRNSFGSGPMPFSDGKHLIVGVDGIGVWIYNNIPDESKAATDVVVGKLLRTTVVGGQAITDGKRLIMVHREGSSVMIWNEIPKKDNQLPNIILGSVITFDNWGKSGSGRTGMNNPNTATTDGQRLIVADSGNNRILIWNNIPIANQTAADIVLGQKDFDSTSPGNGLAQMNNPTQVATDGKRLVVADQFNNRILVWNSIPTENGKPADFEINIIDHSNEEQYTARISLPIGVAVQNDRLFVSDTGGNRVLAWSKFPSSGTDDPDVVLGQPDLISSYKTNSKDRLFMPGYISFDGSFLWVGEFKFSNRLLRFSVQPS